MEVNGKELELKTLVFESVDNMDYPAFSDAFISNAYFSDGERLTIIELELVNNNRCFVHSQLLERLF
jgi:hypothetical protein